MSYSNWKAPASAHKPGLPSDRTLLEFAQELRAQGASFAEIGKLLGVSAETARASVNREAINARRAQRRWEAKGLIGDGTITPKQRDRIAAAYGVTPKWLQEARPLGLTVRAARERAVEMIGDRSKQSA